MAGYWPSSFLRVYGSRRSRGQYPAILTEQAWSIKDLFYGIKHDKFSLRDKACIPRVPDSSILPARVTNHSARFGSSYPLLELVMYKKNCCYRLRSGRSDRTVTFMHRNTLAHTIAKVDLQPRAVVNFISRLLRQYFSGTH